MYTLGIEQEFFVVSPGTYDLISLSSKEMLSVFGSAIKNEFFNCQVELNTPICKNINELYSQYVEILDSLRLNAEKNNILLLDSATHPLASMRNCVISKGRRYTNLREKLGFTFNTPTCSIQFHVAIDLNRRVPIINYLKTYMPYFLALSASSPFYEGYLTGLASFRSLQMGHLPRSGIPPDFSSNLEYEQYIDLLKRTNSIDNAKEIWWDLRPHPFFPTIECRICDNMHNTNQIIALAALYQALVVKIDRLLMNGYSIEKESNNVCSENKWRAIRYGLDGSFIDGKKEEEIPTRQAIRNLLSWVEDIMYELDSNYYIDQIVQILDENTSAAKQIKIYHDTGNIKDVLNWLTHHLIT